MRAVLWAVCAAAACAALPDAANAQSNESERREACTSDAFKFCAGDIPNRQKIEQCLVANRERLNPDCRAVVDGGRPGNARRR